MVPATSWVEAVICWVEAAISCAMAAESCECCRMVPTSSWSWVTMLTMEVESRSSPARPAQFGMVRSPSDTLMATAAALPVGFSTLFSSMPHQHLLQDYPEPEHSQRAPDDRVFPQGLVGWLGAGQVEDHPDRAPPATAAAATPYQVQIQHEPVREAIESRVQ